MSKRNDPDPSNLGRFSTPDSIVLERVLPGSIELVWEYLTNPERLSRWLAGGVIDPRRGGAIELDFDLIRCPGRENIHGTMSGVITAFEPPHLLAYSWNEGTNSRDPVSTSLVTFTLEPMGKEQTKLTLTHTSITRQELSGVAAGWHVHLDVLERRISNVEPEHFEIAWRRLDQRYRQLL